MAAGKKKTPQVVEALEMLKNIFFEQEYVSRIQNHESEFKKSGILFHDYYSNILL